MRPWGVVNLPDRHKHGAFQRYKEGAFLPVKQCMVGGCFTFASAEIAALVPLGPVVADAGTGLGRGLQRPLKIWAPQGSLWSSGIKSVLFSFPSCQLTETFSIIQSRSKQSL